MSGQHSHESGGVLVRLPRTTRPGIHFAMPSFEAPYNAEFSNPAILRPAPGVSVKASIDDLRRLAADFLSRLSASDMQGLIVEPRSPSVATSGGAEPRAIRVSTRTERHAACFINSDKTSTMHH